MSLSTLADLIALLAAAGGIGALIWVSARGDPERDREDEARDYFDAHGRWPDDAG